MSATRRQKATRAANQKRIADDLQRASAMKPVKVKLRPGYAGRLAMKKYVPNDIVYPSVESVGAINVSKPGKKIYTGDVVLGIATMHKSNAVPVISQQEAQEIARMSQ
tara:strand:- start:10833 stop:11156 length:324 start_codon:yes stop_codon:yes gene_type:complete